MLRAFTISIFLHIALVMSVLRSEWLPFGMLNGKALQVVLAGAIAHKRPSAVAMNTGDVPKDPEKASLNSTLLAKGKSSDRAVLSKTGASTAANDALLSPNLGRETQAAESLEALSAEGERQYRLNVARQARRFRGYPTLAKERGWQGVVVISVSMSPSSYLPKVELEKSSGYEELDSQALEMTQKAVAIAEMPASIQGKSFKLMVPVEYRLER